jgi:hypothetical protein
MGALLSRSTRSPHTVLARLVQAVSTTEHCSRLRKLAEGPDTVIPDLQTEDRLQHIDSDLVVIDTGTLTIPVNEAVLALKQMATTPEWLMASANAHAEDRAKMLTEGSLAVIPDKLPDAPFRTAAPTSPSGLTCASASKQLPASSPGTCAPACGTDKPSGRVTRRPRRRLDASRRHQPNHPVRA